jgi:hypothetical protein
LRENAMLPTEGSKKGRRRGSYLEEAVFRSP